MEIALVSASKWSKISLRNSRKMPQNGVRNTVQIMLQNDVSYAPKSVPNPKVTEIHDVLPLYSEMACSVLKKIPMEFRSKIDRPEYPMNRFERPAKFLIGTHREHAI